MRAEWIAGVLESAPTDPTWQAATGFSTVRGRKRGSTLGRPELLGHDAIDLEGRMRPLAGRFETPAARWSWRKRTAVLLATGIIALYLAAAPGGLMGKADLVAYAFCHRIPSHSLLVNGRPMPLCARCTGTYLGALLALGTLALLRRRYSELPTLPVLLTLIGFSVLMGVDGLNSYLTLVSGREALYPPQNGLRLLTGALHGLMMGSIMYPVAMGTFWRRFRPEPVLSSFRDLGVLVLLAVAVVGLALTGWPVALYSLALLSSAGLMIMLTLVNSVLLLILFRRENRAERWRDLAVPLLLGLAASLVLVGSIDLVRYLLTGTLTGLPGLPQ